LAVPVDRERGADLAIGLGQREMARESLAHRLEAGSGKPFDRRRAHRGLRPKA
jgi:hypothetical protein